MRRIRTDDAGFTLPELLVVIVALGVITPALAAAFATGVRTTAGSTERLSASNASELVSTWFVPDVQSAESLSKNAHDCFEHPPANTFLFTATRTEGAVTLVTGYATAGATPATRTLVRYSCSNGVRNPTLRLADAVRHAEAPEVSTTKVALAVTVEDASDAGYTFHLNATRRVS